jgi:ABC-type uncharacterized transport system substrate-binding protein
MWRAKNVTIEYRWAEDRMDRLQLLAADLVSRSVAAIVTAGPQSSFAAKPATTTIPIVFMTGSDPVDLGLSTSLSRPSGNLTGISFLVAQLGAKRLELLRDLLPHVSRVGVLVSPAEPTLTDIQLKEVTTAARTMGIQIKSIMRILAPRSMLLSRQWVVSALMRFLLRLRHF